MNDSLQDETKFKLILTVSPAESYLSSSLDTLKFGHYINTSRRQSGIKTNQIKVMINNNFNLLLKNKKKI
jgi:spore coat protein U-like protein